MSDIDSKIVDALVDEVLDIVEPVARNVASHETRLKKIEEMPTPVKGEAGPPGRDGINGKDGAPGVTGKDGAPGERGEKGVVGERGERGEKGEVGQKGDVGESGTNGDRGEPGEKGEPGERGTDGVAGEKGLPGEKGDAGDAGPKGDPGEKGLAGEQGVPGIAGEIGATGQKGDAGEPGARGDPGANGEPGERGAPGEKGADGTSYTQEQFEAAVEKRAKELTNTWIVNFGMALEREFRDKADAAIAAMPKPKDGADGISFDDVTFDDERTLSFTNGEKSFKVKLGHVLDRGVYDEIRQYEKGDGVTCGGSFWIAREDTKGLTPGANNNSWRLAVKKGRDAPRRDPHGAGTHRRN